MESDYKLMEQHGKYVNRLMELPRRLIIILIVGQRSQIDEYYENIS